MAAVETDDWLDLPSSRAPVEPKARRLRRPRDLTLAERALSHVQRFYVKALLECDSVKKADAVMRKHGYQLDRTTLYRWRRMPAFVRCLHLTQEFGLACLGLSKEKIMLDAEKVKQIAMRPKLVLYKGEPTGQTEVELGSYLRALELQAKGVGITDGTDRTVQVNIDIDFSGRVNTPGVVIEGQ